MIVNFLYMMKPIFLSTSFNITYNLTVEEHLFNNLHKLPSPLLYKHRVKLRSHRKTSKPI